MVVVIPVGNGHAEDASDTIASVWHYLGADQPVVAALDHTDDGTERALRAACAGPLDVIRDPHGQGIGAPVIMQYLTHKRAFGLRHAVETYEGHFLLTMDIDALVTGYGLIDDVLAFMARNPEVGIFGRHLLNVDGTIKSYRMHTGRLRQELSLGRRLTFRAPAYAPIAQRALARGWGLGENVFGGACIITWPCLAAMYERGYLHPPVRRWRSKISDDVYFTMCAIAAGFDRGQFGAPNGPLCLAWQHLPLPPSEIQARGYKLVHSVDKGAHTSRDDNAGVTAREYFRAIRRQQADLTGAPR